MLTLFFSGTGNTKYVAERFSAIMGGDCFSIEDNADFAQLIESHKCICVCYPIYGSRMPRIFKSFIESRKALFRDKDVIILVTQLVASGDGARSFTDIFPHKYLNVIYAEHINMPNNICNFPLFPVKNGGQNRRKLAKANAKIAQVCEDIREGRTVRRGFSPVFRLLGLVQGAFEESMNEYGRSSVKIDKDCIACGLCVNVCPTKNLRLLDGKIEQNNNCTLCYRCVNLCPEKSITTLFHKKPKIQYRGINKAAHGGD